MFGEAEFNKSLNELLREFIRVFGEKGVDENLLRGAKEHLDGKCSPNPIGFPFDINREISPFCNAQRIIEAVKGAGINEVKSAVNSLSVPLQEILKEVIFLAEYERIQELVMKSLK